MCKLILCTLCSKKEASIVFEFPLVCCNLKFPGILGGKDAVEDTSDIMGLTEEMVITSENSAVA